jgi:hypothetical protein
MTILTMFVMAIVLWTLDLANFIMEAKITLIENSDDPIDAKLHKALAFVFHLEGVQNLLYAYMVSALLMFDSPVCELLSVQTLLGDAIIIHRVWKLQAFSGRAWALLVPCAILFGSLGTPPDFLRGCSRPTKDAVATVMLTVCITELGPDIQEEKFKNDVCTNVQIITFVMPSANTAIATGLIGLTSWYAFMPSLGERPSNVNPGNTASRLRPCLEIMSV